jgi:Na+/melibiose symporter-like transporter
VCLFSAFGLTAGVELAAPAAILADVVDYDQWKSGTNKAGNYNAFLVITQKAAIALGSAAGYLLLDLFGYDIKGGHNGAAATSGFLLTLVYVPCALYMLAALFMWNFPIDRRRHSVIRRRLDTRRARLS